MSQLKDIKTLEPKHDGDFQHFEKQFEQHKQFVDDLCLERTLKQEDLKARSLGYWEVQSQAQRESSDELGEVTKVDVI